MFSGSVRNVFFHVVSCTVLVSSTVATAQDLTVVVDPVTRYFSITYPVPESTPDTVEVVCSVSPAGANEWQPAPVMPAVSETAMVMLPADGWAQWQTGHVTERRAAGLDRILRFNPYPVLQRDGRVDADFRIVIRGEDDAELATYTTHLKADNSDVVYIEDWSQVFQQDQLQEEGGEDAQKWQWRTGWEDTLGMSQGNSLHGDAGLDTPIPPLSYPLDLRGWYAIYVHVPGVIRLRLTGEERTDYLSSRRGEEVLWKWAKLDHQNLVLEQSHNYKGYVPATIDYVKLVPLTEEQHAALEAPFTAPHDKFIAGYWEPYSYAFHDRVENTLWHREFLTAYPEANIDLVDMQIGRMGMKVV